MHASNQRLAVSRPSSKVLLWICMAAWALSFFVPAIRSKNFFVQDRLLGFQAFISSVIGFFIPIYGWVWPVNIFMILAPVYARRMDLGKNIRMYVLLFSAWAGGVLAVPIYMCTDQHYLIARLEIGYYLWQLSLVGAATWFLWMHFRRFAIVAAAGLIGLSFLIGSATIAPAFVLRRDLRKELRSAEAAIADFERTGRPEFMNLYGAEINNFVDLRQPGVRDFQLAAGYMSDIYTCRERGRISDDPMIDRYPEVPVHAAEAAHAQEPPGSWHPGAYCLKDDSARQPWMSYRDLQTAALKRAKLYVRNAEIEAGMIHGQRQLPELLGSADLIGVSPFARTDLPARFSNIGSLVQIVRAGTQTEADIHAVLEKQDTVATGTSSTATLVFADQTACTVQPGSQIMIEENSINASGRTFVKVELVQGKIVMQSARRIYRSSLQVEFVTVQGAVNMAPESLIEVQSDPATSISQVLPRKGAAEVRLAGEPPVKLAESERFIFANNGQRITTKDTAAPELLMSQAAR